MDASFHCYEQLLTKKFAHTSSKDFESNFQQLALNLTVVEEMEVYQN